MLTGEACTPRFGRTEKGFSSPGSVAALFGQSLMSEVGLAIGELAQCLPHVSREVCMEVTTSLFVCL